MRKLILKMHVTIDGFVAGTNGEADWIFKRNETKRNETVSDGVTRWDRCQQCSSVTHCN